MSGTDPLLYLDASIVIDGTDPNSPLYSAIASALRVVPPNETAVSEMVRMECLIHPVRTGDTTRTTVLERFLDGLVNLPLDRTVYDLAIDLRARHQGLKTPDALHLAVALRHGCKEFWTNDRDLAKRPVGLTFRSF